jgi:hypothetical protein
MKSKFLLQIFIISGLILNLLFSCQNNKNAQVDNPGNKRSGLLNLKPKTIAEVRNELRLLEIDSISYLIEMQGKIDSIDNGFLVFHDYKAQINVLLKNKACVAKMKDIAIAVDFISKTGSKISDKQFTVYEFIEPNNSITFKENIEIPDQTSRVEFRLLKVVGE